MEIENSIAANIPQPLQGVCGGGRAVPIALKYQRAGTGGCQAFEWWGLKSCTSTGWRDLFPPSASPILAAFHVLRRGDEMRTTIRLILVAGGIALLLDFCAQRRLLGMPSDERDADRTAITAVLNAQ